jgi:hypothetical protein
MQLSLYKSHVKIPGFKVFVVEEWLDESPLLFSSVAVATGQPSDVMVCHVLRISGSASAEQQKLIQASFLKPRVAGLSILPVEVSGFRLGDVVVADLEELQNSGLHVIEVHNGSLQGDALFHIRCNIVLRLFNCMKPSQVSSAPPPTDCTSRFAEMYQSFLQSGQKSDVNFRTLVRRLVRRVQGALQSLMFLPMEADLQGVMNKVTIEAIDSFRSEQPHQTIGVTPELLRSLRKQQEILCKKLGRLGYATPSDPWAEGSKLVQAVQSAAAAYEVTPVRRNWAVRKFDDALCSSSSSFFLKTFTAHLDHDLESAGESIESDSSTVPVTIAVGRGSLAPAPMSSTSTSMS